MQQMTWREGTFSSRKEKVIKGKLFSLPVPREKMEYGGSKACHWSYNTSTLEGQKEARRNTPLRLGWEEPPSHRPLWAHVNVLSFFGLLSWCHPCSTLFTMFLCPQNVLPSPDPHWLQFVTVFCPCYPIDSPSLLPLPCTTFLCSHWYLTLRASPFSPYLTLCLPPSCIFVPGPSLG